jgi:glycosyltransferase involved in cell wall biosynthesis
MIYNPHDLQHLHYPQFFTPAQITWRETIYRTGCRLAHTVAVASEWVKQDIVQHYHVNPDKVQVIPCAPPTQAYHEPDTDALHGASRKYRLKNPFALYPSMTWAHKNHIRLLEAVALLRDRKGLRVNLVCTGHKNDFWPRIEKRLMELELEDQVRFLGMIPPEHLRALYRLARFVVIPSLFEAASGPLFEAWQDDTPVACSMVTSLPEQAGDAALLFDPASVEGIAEAVAEMASDDNLLQDLRRRGRRRLQGFSWERTAKAYRAIYRRAAGVALSEEDRSLLNWDWMREPQREREIQT